MPGLDGWQTAARLRGGGYRGPLVMLSANARDNQSYTPAGLHDDYLVKPFKLSGLLDSLARHLDLTWRHQGDGDTPPPRPRPAPAVTLDERLRDELLALAEIGHLAGLRDALDRAEGERRLDAAAGQPLRAALARFDFQALIRLLEPEP